MERGRGGWTDTVHVRRGRGVSLGRGKSVRDVGTSCVLSLRCRGSDRDGGERRESREKEANKGREEAEEEEQSAGCCVRCVYRGRTVATPARCSLSCSLDDVAISAVTRATLDLARFGPESSQPVTHSSRGEKRDLATDVYWGMTQKPPSPGFGADTVQVAASHVPRSEKCLRSFCDLARNLEIACTRRATISMHCALRRS